MSTTPIDPTERPAEVLEEPHLVGDPRDEPTSLRRLAARGTLINAAFFVGLQTLGLFKSFAVAVFLSKSEYGVWGILVIALGTLAWLKEGLGEKFVQQDDDDQCTAFQRAFTIDLIANSLLMLLMLATLPLFALAYGQWSIVAPGLVLIAVLPAMSLRAPTWIFYRQLRYGRQRALEAVDPIVSLIVTIVLAVAGLGYWSLVIGFAAGVWAAGAVAVALSPYPLRLRYDRKTAGEYFHFTWPLFVSNLSVLFIPQISMLAGEAKLGLAGAGVIQLAGTIGTYTDRVDAVITEALYPAICRVKDRVDVLYEAFVKSNRLDLMWGVPFGVAVTLYAPDLVHFVIGEKWESGLVLIQAFGLISALNHFGYNWAAFLRARDETRPMAVVGPIVLLAFCTMTLPLLIAFGLDGLAVGMCLMVLVSLGLRAHYVKKLFPGYSMIRQAIRAILPTLPAVGVALAFRELMPGARTPGAAVAEIALYVGVTAAATLVLERALVREVIGYLRGRSRPFADAV